MNGLNIFSSAKTASIGASCNILASCAVIRCRMNAPFKSLSTSLLQKHTPEPMQSHQQPCRFFSSQIPLQCTRKAKKLTVPPDFTRSDYRRSPNFEGQRDKQSLRRPRSIRGVSCQPCLAHFGNDWICQ